MFVAHKEQVTTKPEANVFNYIFAGDLLLGLAKKIRSD